MYEVDKMKSLTNPVLRDMMDTSLAGRSEAAVFLFATTTEHIQRVTFVAQRSRVAYETALAASGQGYSIANGGGRRGAFALAPQIGETHSGRHPSCASSHNSKGATVMTCPHSTTVPEFPQIHSDGLQPNPTQLPPHWTHDVELAWVMRQFERLSPQEQLRMLLAVALGGES